MRDVGQKIAEFFNKKRIKFELNSQLYSNGLIQDNRRTRGFKSLSHNPSPNKGRLWSKLSGTVYNLIGFGVSAIVAVYLDGTILWLDEYPDDSDYEVFVRRENLSSWLPNQMDELSKLLVETKLNYWGWPRLIRNTLDIPMFTERDKKQIKSRVELEGILESEEKLVQFRDLIIPPQHSYTQSQASQLEFFIWTPLGGRIVKVHCDFESDNMFRYQTIILTDNVGKFAKSIT